MTRSSATEHLFSPSILSFEPRFEERIWGSRRLERFGKRIPESVRIGESWEISDVDGAPSLVRDGPERGRSLRGLLEAHSEEILGARSLALLGPGFPLLFKLLDAAEDLSVQVHPSDEDLRRAGQSLRGKTEAWIVLEAEPGARIVHGLAPGVDLARFLDRMEELRGGPLPEGEAESLLGWVPVTRGDVVFVPAGTVHALGRGLLVLEVQQTSDITYRVHDWGRRDASGRPRALHIAEARRLAAPPRVPVPTARLRDVAAGTGFGTLVDSDKFRIEAARLRRGTLPLRESTQGVRAGFHVLCGVEGSTLLSTAGHAARTLSSGEFVLLPSALGAYEVASRGDALCLRSSA
jgi:mannose-6-phosphate isomerase